MRRASFSINVDSPNALWVYDKRALKRTMRQAGAEVANAAKAAMRASGGGRAYSGKGGRRLASLPGQAPAVATRKLIRSIKIIPYKSGEGVAVRATEFYSLFLEGGAEGSRRTGQHKKGQYSRIGRRVLLPRPFLSAALTLKSASLAARIRASVQGGIAFQKQK